MLKIPRLALYKPHEEDAPYISSCFPREEYSIRVVESPEQIIDLINDEGSPFDAIILPPKGRDNDGGLTFCSQVRENPELNRTPLLSLTDDPSGHIIRALYDAGADTVICVPFNPRIIFLQINALHRFRTAFEEQIGHAFELSGLRTTTTKAINCAREGILLFDPGRTVSFMNTAAGRLLGISWDTAVQIIDRVSAQFVDLIVQHEGAALNAGEFANQDPVSELPMSIARIPVQRASGQPFLALVRALTLVGEHGELYGTAIAITDVGEFEMLAAQVQQAHRTRALCLAAAAGCLHLARGTAPIKSPSAADLFAIIEGSEQPRCSFSAVTTAFLETLDLMVPPSVQIKINLQRDVPLALKPGELFQIMGHLVLEGVDFCGVGGIIEIGSTEIPEFNSIRLTVTAQSNRSVPLALSDHFTALLSGSTTFPDENEDGLTHGLAAARSILKKYGDTPVTQERPNDATLLLRVLLPQAAAK